MIQQNITIVQVPLQQLNLLGELRMKALIPTDIQLLVHHYHQLILPRIIQDGG